MILKLLKRKIFLCIGFGANFSVINNTDCMSCLYFFCKGQVICLLALCPHLGSGGKTFISGIEKHLHFFEYKTYVIFVFLIVLAQIDFRAWGDNQKWICFIVDMQTECWAPSGWVWRKGRWLDETRCEWWLCCCLAAASPCTPRPDVHLKKFI